MRSLSLALSGAMLLAMHGAALAHITLETIEAPAGSTYKGVLRVGHGCEGAATNVVRVQIPAGVIAVKPMPKPGWTLETTVGPYPEPVPYFDQTLTEGVQEIIWSGGELPDEWYDEFVFRAHLPDGGQPGQVLYFPAIQECGDTATRWIEIPAEGQVSDDLEEPAPAVTLTAPAAE